MLRQTEKLMDVEMAKTIKATKTAKTAKTVTPGKRKQAPAAAPAAAPAKKAQAQQPVSRPRPEVDREWLTVGRKLQEDREAIGWSRVQFGAKFDCDEAWIRRVEEGRALAPAPMVKYASDARKALSTVPIPDYQEWRRMNQKVRRPRKSS